MSKFPIFNTCYILHNSNRLFRNKHSLAQRQANMKCSKIYKVAKTTRPKCLMGKTNQINYPFQL